MRADELRTAVDRIVEILAKADVLSAVDRFRSARGADRTIAAARLGHSGAIIMQCFEQLSSTERKVVRHLHLHTLATQDYWDGLMASAGTPGSGSAEIVRLASRVMYASNHLPGLANMLAETESAAQGYAPLTPVEGRLLVRLTDAGERASDPDRVARSIDGIDMLYSACASIARKPAIDLRLDGISGDDSRDISFTGDRDAVSAATAVLDSIPEAIAEFDESADLDLDDIVASLPVFEDLQTLASLGSFTSTDLKDITETMYQGAMLALESGVTRLELQKAETPRPDTKTPRAIATPVVNGARAVAVVPSPDTDDDAYEPPTLTRSGEHNGQAASGNSAAQQSNGSAADHYNHYLQEREAMQQTAPSERPAPALPRATAEALDDEDFANASFDDKDGDAASRKDSVEELLEALGKGRRKR